MESFTNAFTEVKVLCFLTVILRRTAQLLGIPKDAETMQGLNQRGNEAE